MQSTQNVQQIDQSEIGLAPEKPEKASYDQLYRRVLREVLTRIDTRLAAIEKPGVAADAAAAASTSEATGSGASRWARMRAPLGKLRGRNAVGLALLVVLVGGSVAWSQRDAGTSLMDRWMPGASEASQDEASVQQGSEDAMMSNASLRGAEDTTGGREPGTLMQRMARDIAELQQGIEQIKSTQDQASRDHTRAIEQLQAGQDQLMRLVSRMSNQAVQARGTAVPPGPPQQIIVTPQQRTTTGMARPQPAQPQGSTFGTLFTRNTSGIQPPMPR
ncbi:MULTISPECIES: hypothetical protein [unclassified Bradyrhizobium]|uniref:hypothetical protein n=1 Tax=unclassified Bradyrhizobium TaxID=2631580 RepID=UPI002916C1CB|nr:MULTISPECIES: hypothetical protein [unclassified Bradyrhizobium]